MENQHRQIKGYRDLTQEEIDLMNEIKTKGVELQALVQKVQTHVMNQYHQLELAKETAGVDAGPEQDRLAAAEPGRWASIGRTHFQEGLMALTRAVAQPGFF